MQNFLFVLLCILSTFYVATAGPTFLASLPANSIVQSSIPLRFAANQPIDPNSMACTATGCTCNILGLSGLTATVTVSCSMDGLVPLVFTAADMDGNTGELSINYVYHSVGPIFDAYKPPNSPIKANTRLSFTANTAIQSSSLLITSPTCTFSQNALVVTLVSCSEQGAISITLSALDEHGNIGTNTFDYVYDTVAPTIVSNVPSVPNPKVGDVLTYSVNEPIQPQVHVSARFWSFDTPIVSGQTISFTLLSFGTQPFQALNVTATDLAGNVGSVVDYYNCEYGVNFVAQTDVNTALKADTALLFTCGSTIDPSSILLDIPGCQYDLLSTSTYAVGFTLTSCDYQGPFTTHIAGSTTSPTPMRTGFAYIYDSIGPVLTPKLPANSKVAGNTPLFFVANEDLQADIVWNASGCTFGSTAMSGQTLSTTL